MSNIWLKRVCNNPLIIAFDRGSWCIMQILTAYYWFAKEYMANIALQWCAYIIYICILVLRLSSYTFQYIMLQKWIEVLMLSQTLCHYIFVHINVQISEVYSLWNILLTSNVICVLHCSVILAIYSLANQ